MKCAQCGAQSRGVWAGVWYCTSECREAREVAKAIRSTQPIAPSKAVAVVRPGGFSTREPEE